MHTQTNNAQNTNFSNRLGVGKLPTTSTWHDDNWHLGSIRSLQGKCEHSAVFPNRCTHKCIIHLVHKINKLCLILTFIRFHFLMIKVRSCTVSVIFSRGSFLWIVPLTSALNEIDVWNFSRGILHFAHTHFINLQFIHYCCRCGGKLQPHV